MNEEASAHVNCHWIKEAVMAVLACWNVEHTPYSKMPENTSFFCLNANWPLLPRFKPNIPLNSADEIEATRAN